MKESEWKRVVRPLLPTDHSWAFRGSLCYRLPVGRVLTGLLAESSSFDKGAYVYRFSMALFEPREYLELSFSERIGGGAHKYYLEEPDDLTWAIKTAIGDLKSDEDELRRMIVDGTPFVRNVRVHEIVAYAHLLLGDLNGASSALSAIAAVDPQFQASDVLDRTRLISRLLAEKGPTDAIRQLDAWRDQTVGALGLRVG